MSRTGRKGHSCSLSGVAFYLILQTQEETPEQHTIAQDIPEQYTGYIPTSGIDLVHPYHPSLQDLLQSP